MMNRFKGPNGPANLATALKKSVLVEHNQEIADQLVAVGEVIEVADDDDIVTQDDGDNDIFFLLTGEAQVLINGNRVATRGSGQVIGEMALLDPTAPRSATVRAKSAMTVLKVSQPDFRAIADAHPQIFETLSRIIADKLRQRGSGLSFPNNRPRLFIGCAVEGLPIADEIELGLEHDNIEVIKWTNGVFNPSGNALDSLIDQVRMADFAAFIFSPDDKIVSRDQEFDTPRDNVVFELGLFMGHLERNRTFIVQNRKDDLKFPSDLLGITAITYSHTKGSELETSLSTVCTQLRKAIAKLGTKPT